VKGGSSRVVFPDAGWFLKFFPSEGFFFFFCWGRPCDLSSLPFPFFYSASHLKGIAALAKLSYVRLELLFEFRPFGLPTLPHTARFRIPILVSPSLSRGSPPSARLTHAFNNVSPLLISFPLLVCFSQTRVASALLTMMSTPLSLPTLR